jgi:hypothetical protein
MRSFSLLAAALAGLIAVPTLAQAPPPDGTPTRIRGTVEKLDGSTLESSRERFRLPAFFVRGIRPFPSPFRILSRPAWGSFRRFDRASPADGTNFCHLVKI